MVWSYPCMLDFHSLKLSCKSQPSLCEGYSGYKVWNIQFKTEWKKPKLTHTDKKKTRRWWSISAEYELVWLLDTITLYPSRVVNYLGALFWCWSPSTESGHSTKRQYSTSTSWMANLRIRGSLSYLVLSVLLSGTTLGSSLLLSKPQYLHSEPFSDSSSHFESNFQNLTSAYLQVLLTAHDKVGTVPICP